MQYILTFFAGVILIIILVAVLKYTPQVTSNDVERAISVCKDGKWVSINNTDIICVDGATYPRYVKSRI